MGVKFDRDKYFAAVRESLFYGSMDQEQVDGQEALLSVWEKLPEKLPPDVVLDLRWLSYMLSTAGHETGFEFQPIVEYGAPTCGGAEYAEIDPETGNRFYGRCYVQLTWKSNYERATKELELTGADDLVWHPDRALDPIIASKIMFRGMWQGWFRTGDDGKPETLEKYFNEATDDAYGAREIINGDKHIVPDWSGGVSIGNLIAGYHRDFLAALEASAIYVPAPEPPEPAPIEPIEILVDVHVTTPLGVPVNVTVRQV
jgi:putative chitinase